LKAVTGNLSIDSLQKTATFVTSHIIRRALQSENGTLREVSPLFKENYQRNNTHDMRQKQQHNNNNNNNNNNSNHKLSGLGWI